MAPQNTVDVEQKSCKFTELCGASYNFDTTCDITRIFFKKKKTRDGQIRNYLRLLEDSDTP